MFSHVMIGTNDLDRARRFYDAVLGTLGAGPGTIVNGNRLAYDHGGNRFVVGTPIDGAPATHANGGTIGFHAASPAQADAWHAAGLANGGTSCEDPPGERHRPGGRIVYLAYLRDPDGNKLCALHLIAAGG